MAFGPIMKFKVGELDVEMAPLTKDVMGEFISHSHGGGMQSLGITQYIGRQQAPALEDEHDWFEKTRQDSNSLIWGIWVWENGNRVLIGNSALVKIDQIGHTPLFRQAETGSMIFRKDYWGKGIASAAHKARTWYAFHHLGLHAIKSGVIQANQGSRKALEKSGYVLTHTTRNEQFSGGKFHHLDNFRCLNPADIFWNQWWHEDEPTEDYTTARSLTQEVMNWATQNVTL